MPGSPADQAGLGPEHETRGGERSKWSAEVLRAAVKSAVTNRAPIELLVVHDDNYQTSKWIIMVVKNIPSLNASPRKPDLLDGDFEAAHAGAGHKRAVGKLISNWLVSACRTKGRASRIIIGINWWRTPRCGVRSAQRADRCQ